MKDIKKWMTLALAFSVVVSVSACGTDEKGQDGPPYTSTVTNESPEKEEPDTEEPVAEDEGFVEEDAEETYDEDSDGELMISDEEIKLLYGNVTSVSVFDNTGDVTWTNSNPEAVELEPDGSYTMIRSLKANAEATITASVEGQGEVSCQVKVISVGFYLQDDRGNDAGYSSGTYGVGKQHTYKAFYDGEEIAASDLTWGSLDENVVTVDAAGTVTTVGEGRTYIYATDQSGETAYAAVWISDTDDEWEFETTISGYGLFFTNMFGAYEEHILSGIEGESALYALYDVYDDGELIDASTLEWSVEDVKGHIMDIDTEEMENMKNWGEIGVGVIYTQEVGKAFLVATNPATGHVYKFLIVTYD